MTRQTKWKSSAFPYYGVAVLWLLFMIFRQSGRTILTMGSSIVLFLLLRLVVPCSAQQKEIEAEPGTNDNTFPEQLLQKCAATVQALSRMAQQIQNTDVRGKVSQLEELSGKILNEVKERPEKTSKISTFVNYYIPTTINILNAYRRAEATGIEGENISKTKKQIESMLDSSILVVFHKQLDNLFGADALDISLELSVLEEMMIREGIVGEKLEAQTLKNSDGSDIQLTL